MADTAGCSGETPTNMDSSHEECQMPVPKIKHDWYQKGSEVIVSILVKNAENVKIDCRESTLSVSARLPSGNDYSLELDLAHPVQPDQCTYKVTRFKIEIKLKKRDAITWANLEGNPDVEKPSVAPVPQEILEASNPVLKYPSSCRNPKDWAKLERELERQATDEEPMGDAAVDALLQQVYAKGSDEVKRAMNKSYQESAGTVLSTNWSEVRKSKVEMKPPASMEWKSWN